MGAADRGARDRARGRDRRRRRGSRRSRRSASCASRSWRRARSRSPGRCARSISIPTSDALYADVLRLAERARAVARGRRGVRARSSRGEPLPEPIAAQAVSASSRGSRAAGSPTPSARAPTTARSSRSRPTIARPSSTSRSSRSSSPTGPSCSRRTAGAPRARRMPTERASLLIEIASLQEEKLVDLDGAAATYHEALAALPGQLRALRALARIEEARGDWESLVERARARSSRRRPTRPRGQARFDLLMRLGELEETRPRARRARRSRTSATRSRVPGDRRRRAAAGGRRDRRAILRADARRRRSTPAERVAAARLVLPHLEAGEAVAAAGRGARGDPRRRRHQPGRAARARSRADAALSHRARRSGRGVARPACA